MATAMCPQYWVCCFADMISLNILIDNSTGQRSLSTFYSEEGKVLKDYLSSSKSYTTQLLMLEFILRLRDFQSPSSFLYIMLCPKEAYPAYALTLMPHTICYRFVRRSMVNYKKTQLTREAREAV